MIVNQAINLSISSFTFNIPTCGKINKDFSPLSVNPLISNRKDVFKTNLFPKGYWKKTSLSKNTANSLNN